MTRLLVWIQALMLAFGAVPAGDDTPVMLYAIVGGIALILVIAAIVLTVLSNKKKK